MNGCGLIGVAAGVIAIAAAVIWIAAVVTYVMLLRKRRGGASSLVLGSLWLFQSGSVGVEGEPLRRRLVMLFGLFAVSIVLAAAISVTIPAVCGAA